MFFISLNISEICIFVLSTQSKNSYQELKRIIKHDVTDFYFQACSQKNITMYVYILSLKKVHSL